VSARGRWPIAAAALAFATGAHAQAPAAPPPASDRMARDERVLFGLLTATYGLRLGTAINLGAFGRTVNDPHPETFWILPGALAVAVPLGALLIERRFPLRRGRGLSAGVGGFMGYLAATSIATYAAGESFPSGVTLSGWATFVGTTSGIALGALVGHLTDAAPADALFVGTGGVGGALLGGLLCGAMRCGADLGAWSLAGELGLVTTALLIRGAVRPTAPTMRLVGAGAVGLGLLMGGGVLVAHAVRDGQLTADGVQRGAVFATAGLAVGAVTFFAMGRRAEAAAAAVVPTVQAGGGAVVLGVAVTRP
jgi:hypothetical protein